MFTYLNQCHSSYRIGRFVKIKYIFLFLETGYLSLCCPFRTAHVQLQSALVQSMSSKVGHKLERPTRASVCPFIDISPNFESFSRRSHATYTKKLTTKFRFILFLSAHEIVEVRNRDFVNHCHRRRCQCDQIG